MNYRFAACFTAFITAFILLSWSCMAWCQTIRFCPGVDVPIAFNPTTEAYEEGGSFDPYVCAEEPCIETLHNIFEPLVSTSNDQHLESQLATDWEQLDEVTFRFRLRREVVFHNGERFDATAVHFSLMRASQAYGSTAWFPEITRVDIIDPYTVDVALKEPDSLFLYRLGHIGLIQPPRYFRRVGLARFGENPIGTGAFQFVRWDGERREIHMEANPNYWRRDHPKVKRLIYTYMDSEKAFNQLIAGKLDLIRRLNPRKTTQFMRTGAGKIVKSWLPQLVLGSFNLLKHQSPLKDLKVRQAINLAIHRKHLIRFGAIGNGRLLGGYTLPEDPNHAGLAPYPLNVTKAQQLLQEAGYSDGFPLSILVDKQVPPQIENIIAVCLGRIGIATELKRVSESELLNELYLPKFAAFSPPSFDIFLFSMPVGTIFHSGMVPMTLLYSKEPNESALRDPFLDQLYEEALRTYNSVNASMLWKKLEQYVYDKHLLLTCYQERAVFGVNRRLQFTPRTLMSFWDAYYEE